MRIREMMWLGVACGAVGLFGSIVTTEFSVVTAILSFGGGMIFGKGYGIWEERQSDLES